MPNKYRQLTLADRLTRNYRVVEDCWLWNTVNKRTGYGEFKIRIDKKWINVGPHRASYMLFKGEIPEGLVIDHLCNNRSCINPEHLEAVTQKENVHRAETSVAAINAKKTHCIHGHKFSVDNTYIKKNGARFCIKCRTAALLRVKAKRELTSA